MNACWIGWIPVPFRRDACLFWLRGSTTLLRLFSQGLANIPATSTPMSTCFCRHNISPTTRTIGYWNWTYPSLCHTFRWLFGRSSYLIVWMTAIVELLKVICSFIVMRIFYLFHFHSQSRIMTCCMMIVHLIAVAAIFISYTLPSGRKSSPWTVSHRISNPAHNAYCIATACQ